MSSTKFYAIWMTLVCMMILGLPTQAQQLTMELQLSLIGKKISCQVIAQNQGAECQVNIHLTLPIGLKDKNQNFQLQWKDQRFQAGEIKQFGCPEFEAAAPGTFEVVCQAEQDQKIIAEAKKQITIAASLFVEDEAARRQAELRALVEAKQQAEIQRQVTEEKRKTKDEESRSLPVAPVTPVVPSPAPMVRPSMATKSMAAGVPAKAGVKQNQMTESAIRPPTTSTVTDSDFNTESYQQVVENPFMDVSKDPMSTFSIDVDTASYTNIRRFFNQNQLPPPDAVRIEEMVNYFRYAYPQPTGDVPFSVNVDIAECPWSPEHRLTRIGLKGKEISQTERANTNLVFLLDVSGSMFSYNKLPLVKEAMKLLVQNMRENDKVGIVVYAGASGVVLPPTSGANKQTIIEALDRLSAGGSTNAGQGIQLAYQLASENFIPGGVNRVILCTDGDFNVGITNRGGLLRLIQEKAKTKVFLTVLGFGMGNYKDDNLELLADKGNGNYAYIDDIAEAKRVLVEQVGGTLVTIAKDVKIQVEFNPAFVQQYRLIGYENRVMPNQDFHDDTKDAGEIGAGHTVTAFYEIVPVGVKPVETGKVDSLKYQTQPQISEAAKQSGELMTVKLRYKAPEGDVSKLLEFPIRDEQKQMKQGSADLMFASSVVCFGMILQDSKYKGQLKMDFVLELAQEGLGNNPDEYRKEFITLVQKAKAMHK